MTKNPMAQVSAAKRQQTRSFEQIEQKQEPEVIQVEKRAEVKQLKRSRVKFEDFEGKLKRTTVDLPPEIMKAWTLYCAELDITKRDHFLDLIVRELKKAKAL